MEVADLKELGLHNQKLKRENKNRLRTSDKAKWNLISLIATGGAEARRVESVCQPELQMTAVLCGYTTNLPETEHENRRE